ncbi:MAG: type II toxin-antitoxin system VapC family toxin [Deltaproteobacteria bacterium]|jgi:tRNA(fMet)-specific endonuclease VapC|nr:type II toxin-antitoxin system VapC family toxin [Deltaproteobacteria bacterium]MBT4528059.1 type II toxin-antitoxin system VapC family toxin [Deltaproteobacteria bacterium]
MNANLQYLLDTNIISELMRNPHGIIRDRIATIGEEAICTSIIVSSELHFGVEKKGSKKLRSQLEAILSAIEIIPFKEPTDRQYAVLRSNLEKSGTPIGPNDMLIAAQAITYGLTLVTANIREFKRVQGIAVENWLE